MPRLCHLAGTAMVVVVLSIAAPSAATSAQLPSPPQPAAAKPSPLPPTVRQAPIYAPDCTRPTTREDAEFCEARRATANAEAANKLAFLSVAIGLFGCIGLLASLHFTRKATESAREAVVAARATLDHTRDVSEMQLRAYLGIEKVTITDVASDDPPKAIVGLRNYGQTPAYGMTGWLGVNIGEVPEGNLVRFGPIDMQPGGEFKIMRRADMMLSLLQIMDENIDLWVHGEISYRDAFSNVRRVAFRYAWVGEASVGPRGAEHNFTT